MDAQPHARMSAEEFIAWSMQQPEGCRYELDGGRVVPMASERSRHADVKGEIFGQFRDFARARPGEFQIFGDGMAVQIDAETVYEPDAALRYGPRLGRDVVRYDDPVVVVEVLSRSTQGLDIAAKLGAYFRLPSLQHYLVLDADKDRVIHYLRDVAGIRTMLVTGGDVVIDPPGMTINVAALFE